MFKKLVTNKVWQRLLLAALIVFTAAWLNRSEPTLAQTEAPQAVIDGYLPGFYYIFDAGSSLHSADYTMRGDYQSGACISAVDAAVGDYFTLNLDLPDGARIDYLRLYYYDSSASNGTAYLRKYNAAGNWIDIASVDSAGASGFGTTLSGLSGHVVDNSNGAYVLNWAPTVTGATLQLCGLRVAYRYPALDLFLPMVEKH